MRVEAQGNWYWFGLTSKEVVQKIPFLGLLKKVDGMTSHATLENIKTHYFKGEAVTEAIEAPYQYEGDKRFILHEFELCPIVETGEIQRVSDIRKNSTIELSSFLSIATETRYRGIPQVHATLEKGTYEVCAVFLVIMTLTAVFSKAG